MFDFISTLTTNPADALNRANFAVQDKLGKFMSLGAHVIELRDKSKNPALISQGTSLLNGIKTIQTKALGVLGQASELQAKFGPDFSIVNLNKDMVLKAGEIAKNLYAINSDMDAQTKKVNEYAAAVAGVSVASSGNDYAWVAPVAGLVLLGLFAMRKK